MYGEAKNDPTSAAERKISGHVRVLGSIGEVTRYSYDTTSTTKLMKYLRAVTRRLPFFPSKIALKYESSLNGVDAVYIRKSLLDSYMIRFLKECKKHNPSCRIVMEIPTYPYEMELRNWKEYTRLLKDKVQRRKLHLYVDRIVSYSDDASIFGIPVINTINGIEYDSVPMRKISTEPDGRIHLIIVANFSPWHGLGALVDAMITYAEKNTGREVILHVVGGGEPVEKEKQRLLGTPFGTQILFHGKLFDEELDKVYAQCSIALDLCEFRVKGLRRSSTLKTREYGAKGLPMMGAVDIDLKGALKEYCYIFEEERGIRVEDIVAYHDSLYRNDSDYQKVAEQVRGRAESVSEMKVTMSQVLDYFSQN